MGMKGVEPLLLTEPDPKSGAAASYATCPFICYTYTKHRQESST